VRNAGQLGLDVHAPDLYATVPLEYACKKGYLKIASQLLLVSISKNSLNAEFVGVTQFIETLKGKLITLLIANQ
jgi:hypothetical protein